MSDDMSVPNATYNGNRLRRYGRSAARMDPEKRRLMLFAGGLAGVLICLISASTFTRHRSGAVPVVTADVRPTRVKPENPGGMQIDGAENDVFSVGVNNNNSKLAPAAEVPDPSGMHGAPVTTPPAVAQSASQDTSPPAPAAAPLALPSPGEVVAKPPAAAVAAAGSAHPAPAPGATSSIRGASTAGRPTMVQLAAVATEQAARDEWQRMSKHMPDLLNGRQPSFSRVEHDGRTFWRLRTAGFADIAQAKSFCEHVRAKGAGCAVADF
jgi:hypothetical protein